MNTINYSFPVLTANQVALLMTDLYTGIIQDINKQNALTESQQIYSVYESMEEAIKDAEAIVQEHDTIECSILDKEKRIIKLIHPE